MVSFACSEVAQVSRASGAVFAFLVSDVLVLQRFQFQLGKSNDFLSTAVNRTLLIEGADAKKKKPQRSASQGERGSQGEGIPKASAVPQGEGLP